MFCLELAAFLSPKALAPSGDPLHKAIPASIQVITFSPCPSDPGMVMSLAVARPPGTTLFLVLHPLNSFLIFVNSFLLKP